MKTHHFKALYYKEIGIIEQQYIRDWFVDHRVTKYTGRRFSDEMIIMDEVLIYNLIRYMNRLRGHAQREMMVDKVINKYQEKYCCKRTGTIV